MAADSRSAVANGTSSTDGNKAIPEQPLSDAHIDLAVSLVTLLSAEGSLSASAQREMVYIPDASGRLALSTGEFSLNSSAMKTQIKLFRSSFISEIFLKLRTCQR